jgi:hypothetical protein
MATRKHLGTCQCGAVRFAVALDLAHGASRCICSICTKIGAPAVFARPEAFTLLSDDASLGAYGWGGPRSRRYFCKTCGVHCFARGDQPDLGGAYVSVNINVLADVDPSSVGVTCWDGGHDDWEAGPRATPWPPGGISTSTSTSTSASASASAPVSALRLAV